MCKIYIKSCLDGMNEVATNSINLIFTSPPYWDLKDYNHPNQLGLGLTFETYMNFLDNFLLSCSRVLCYDGFCVINVADIRANTSKSNKERPKLFSIQAHIIVKLTSLGLNFHQHTIWKKTSVKKSNKKIIYGACDKTYIYPPFAYNDLNIEHILVFRKPGPLRKLVPRSKRTDKIPRSTLKEEFTSVWEFSEVAQNKNHPAQFPLALADRVIQLFSITGDTVLDPFMGSGTTALSCINNNRKFLGYELNRTYLDSSLSSYLF